MGKIFLLASYPKSGSTWLRALLTNYRHNAASPVSINELDAAPVATDRHVFDETVCLESSDLRVDEIEHYFPRFLREIATGDAPLLIKVHGAYTRNAAGEPLFPEDAIAGAVYIVRNPLDIVSSYAHHADRTVDEIIDMMASDAHGLDLSPDRLYDQLPTKLLSWSRHVLGWLDDHGLNLHLVRYEELVAGPVSALAGVLRFLGWEVDGARVRRAVEFSDFGCLSEQERRQGFCEKQPSARCFFRRGTAGSWRSELSEEQVRRVVRDHGQAMERLGYLPGQDGQGR